MVMFNSYVSSPEGTQQRLGCDVTEIPNKLIVKLEFLLADKIDHIPMCCITFTIFTTIFGPSRWSSLCGVLVFGSASPASAACSSFRPPPPNPHTATCPHTICHHTTCPHTICHHTTCHHTTCPHTICHHTTCPHTICHHTTCPHTTCPHTTCHHTTCHHTTCPHTICHHTTCPHTICHHTTCPHTTCHHTTCPHTICVIQFVITQLVHTQLVHTQLVITPLVIKPLVHIQVVITQLVHIQFVITQLVHTQLVITPLVPTQFASYNLSRLGPSWRFDAAAVLRGRRGTWWHPPSFHVAGVALTTLGWLWWWVPADGLTPRLFCVAGVALGDIHLRFTWQAWHLATSIVTLRGRRGTHDMGLALVTRLGPSWRFDAAAVLRGRRGTWWHPPSFHVAGVALGDVYRHFAWQAWHSRHWAGSGDALGSQLTVWRRGCFAWQAWHLVTSTFVSRGRRGTWRRLSSLCVAGVALTTWGWLWWRAWVPADGLTPRLFCVAGAALGDIHLRFTWQAWHLATSIVTLRGSGGALGSQLTVWRRGCFAWQAWHLVTSTFVSRGRRGTWRRLSSLCVAGVALTTWGWLWWRAWVPADGLTPRLFCVAGVALGDIHLRFTWQAWHLATSIVTLRGRRGTHDTGLALVTRLGPSWRFDAAAVLRGRRGTWWHPPSFHVAGVALGDIYRHFAWQAWHSRHWAGSGDALGSQLTVWRRGCFAWQAWHLVTSTFVSRGRRGTWRHTQLDHNLIPHNSSQSHHSYTDNLITYNLCTHTTYSHVLVHTQLTPHQSFTISFLFPAFPMPSLPFFCCLLEEVDMWGYPVL